ncbi:MULTISPECIES: hypothetical protein [unclassified Kitasatospora]|uniref:hypothetical protein n=1 Tax=unclassified Kitasatospora TaxID=2633591 RepID=UPI001AE02792|nr:hypothetical protein [Kitasatospora sp. RG8]MBP0449003.1 hypothetical protein [Kitasatospora sp. RG8]
MNGLLDLAVQLRLVGAVLVGVGLFHAALPRVIGWPADLDGTTLMTRRVSWAHLFFIGLTCVLLGLLPLLLAGELLAGTPLATALLAGQTVFWGARWLFQFTVFPSRLWRGDPLRTLGHVAFAVLWTWVTAVFACALWRVL